MCSFVALIQMCVQCGIYSGISPLGASEHPSFTAHMDIRSQLADDVVGILIRVA